MITPIWFYRSKHAWCWSPSKPDKNSLNKSNWMIICPNGNLKVICGEYIVAETVPKSIDIILLLESSELAYLI